MKPFKIAYFDRWQHPLGLEMISASPDIELIELSTADPADAVWPRLAEAHGYQIHSSRYDLPPAYFATSALFGRCPNLLAVSATGAGYDTVDVGACTRAGVIAVNQSGGNKEAVAEHTLAMMIALSKRMAAADLALRRERGWHRNDFIGNDIFGKTLGLVGLGNIGSRVAELCADAFKMRVLAYDPYLSEPQFVERKAARVDLRVLLSEADFISLHCPRNAETFRMIGGEQFALMKPSAFFITTARGGIHDEEALYRALVEQRIAGAGIDVWDAEPPPLDHPLLTLDQVIATPHTAGVTHEARRQVALGAVEQWFSLSKGQRPERLLNPHAWPQFMARYLQLFACPIV